jgi:mxaL protein
MHLRLGLTDYRFWCLLFALFAVAMVFLHPTENKKTPVYNFIFIIDITRSMNATDYQVDDQAISRLEFVKKVLRGLLVKLPCQSRVGLGLFTERRSTLLFEPLEICSSYREIDTAISKIDWRMAWAADSNIAKGLLSTLDMLKTTDSAVVFITDGQEAPPVNPSYQADFSSLTNRVRGLIVGAGALQAVPIPKFDSKGHQTGFYTEQDVPHRSTFGQSNLDPSQIEGYNARNAPFGSKAIVGTEHLTALKEAYLQKLAAESGLNYSRLTDLESLEISLKSENQTILKSIQVDIRWRFALMALVILCIVYCPFVWQEAMSKKILKLTRSYFSN